MTANEYLDNSNIQRRSIADFLVESIKSLKAGKILIEVENRPTIDIRASKSNELNKIDIDILDPEVLDIFKNQVVENNERKDAPEEGEDHHLIESKSNSVDKIKDKLDTAKDFFHLFTDTEASIFDQLKIVKDFAVKLSDNNVTIVLLRKGKEAIIMGKDANPSVSKIISGINDLQIKSLRESSKLISEISTTLAHDDNDNVSDKTTKQKK
ncbi:MAG TPA: hypothetical protein VFY50_04505 [Candidatus Nitrosocosmicus sp.]|nr:hypothetical protein [Candidatus Nitrosocosmicus sp.]